MKTIKGTNMAIKKKFLWLPTRFGKECYWLTNFVTVYVEDGVGGWEIGLEYVEKI